VKKRDREKERQRDRETERQRDSKKRETEMKNAWRRQEGERCENVNEREKRER
jgi:hypothetical protein